MIRGSTAQASEDPPRERATGQPAQQTRHQMNLFMERPTVAEVCMHRVICSGHRHRCQQNRERGKRTRKSWGWPTSIQYPSSSIAKSLLSCATCGNTCMHACIFGP